MKHALRLVPRFVLMSLLLILLLSSLGVLFGYVTGYDPERASTADLVGQFLVALRRCSVASILVTAAVFLFVVFRSTDRPFLPLLVLAVTWTAALAAISALWTPSANSAGVPIPVLPDETVVRVSGAAVFAVEVEGLRAGPLVLHREGITPGSELFREAVIDSQAGKLTIPDGPDIELELSQISASYPAMVAVPRRLLPLLRDIRALNHLVLPDDPEGTSALLISVALGVLALACWTLSRVTRWPLFNVVLVFLCLRGALWLIWSIHFDELGRLLSPYVADSRLTMISAGVLTIVSVVLFTVLLLMRPFAHLKREFGDE